MPIPTSPNPISSRHLIAAMATSLLALTAPAGLRAATIAEGDVTATLGPGFFVDDTSLGGTDVAEQQPDGLAHRVEHGAGHPQILQAGPAERDQPAQRLQIRLAQVVQPLRPPGPRDEALGVQRRQTVQVQGPREPVRRAMGDADWRDSYKAHFHAWQFGRLH